MCEADGAQLVLRFDQFRELAEDFFEGNSHFHGMTCATLHQYHLLPYGLVHYVGREEENFSKGGFIDLLN